MPYDQATPTAREGGIMEGFPPPPDRRVDPTMWDRYPFNRWSFQHVRQVLPTRAVKHDPARLRTLPREEADLSGVAVPVPGGGRVALERLLAAESPVERIVPELARCGYAGARLADVLDMRSGVRFVEDYLDPDCEMGLLDRASGWKPARPGDPASIYDLILTLRQDRPHGGKFQYRSIETDLLGWVLERSSGRHLCTLLEELLWRPMGAEADASFTVDPAGTALGDGGLNATLRDYARFGLLMVEDGRCEGRSVIPSAFIEECRRGDPSVFDEKDRFLRFPDACYSRQWWVLDQERGVTAALGIFGQMIYLDRTRGLVMVFLSSWPLPTDPERRGLQLAAADAVGRALE
jgi:CubicO group peptidase (beta-lactamase class C family)